MCHIEMKAASSGFRVQRWDYGDIEHALFRPTRMEEIGGNEAGRPAVEDE